MRISDWSSDVCSSDLKGSFPMKLTYCVALLGGVAGLWSAESAAQSLTLDAANERSISASPEVVAGQATIDRARAELAQAGVRPHPTLGVAAENFSAPGGFRSEERRGGKKYNKTTNN